LLPASDVSGVAVEIAALTVRLAGADSGGVVAESAIASAPIFVVDTGIATEGVVLLGKIFVQESAAGIDNASVSVRIFAFDTSTRPRSYTDKALRFCRQRGRY
jgi:hypothetical protein